MAGTENATLSVTTRTPEGSRATRRMRRQGLVPGVIYGGDGQPETFAVDHRILRNTLTHAGAVLEVSVDGGAATPVIVKDLQRHPVRSDYTHVDFLRVRMDVAIQTTVALDLVGGDESPGVKEGGILSQEHREVTVEALPGDIPDVITFDVSHLEINQTVHLSDVKAPPGVTFVDDPESVVASVTPPTLEPVDDELETETALVGEDGEPVEAAEGEGGEAAADDAGDSGSGDSE